MNARFALAPLGILEILILIGVIFAIFALVRNPNGRTIFLTILTVVLVVGGILFAGFFTLRVAHVPSFDMNSMPGARPSWDMPIMMIKPVLLLCVIFLVVGVIRGVKNKKFSTGTVLIIAVLLVPTLLILFSIGVPVLHRIKDARQTANINTWSAESSTGSDGTLAIIRDTPVDMTGSESLKINQDVLLPPAYTTPSIWQDSVAGQFTANVYPSKAAALKSLRPKIDETLRKLSEGKPTPPKVVLFPGGLSATEIHGLMDTSGAEMPNWTIEPLPRNLQDNEISIAANFSVTGSRTQTRNNQTFRTNTGVIEVSVYSTPDQPIISKAMIDEKPWLEDLAGYQSMVPNGRFAVARSQSSVTDDKTAEWEAFADACNQVAQVLREMNPRQRKLLSADLSVNQTDLESRGMILDRFSQQLYGMAGPICRSALLVDLSPDKIQSLANAKFAIVAEQQRTWARILLSFVGMAAVIALVYVFLNAATRGYYSWSLRIAAVVLLAVGVAIVLSLA